MLAYSLYSAQAPSKRPRSRLPIKTTFTSLLIAKSTILTDSFSLMFTHSGAPNREKEFEEQAGAFEYASQKMVDTALQVASSGKSTSKELKEALRAKAKEVIEAYLLSSDSCSPTRKSNICRM